MGWIRYPDENSLQAVHKVAGEEVARCYLSYEKHGGVQRSHAIARRWLRWVNRYHPPAPEVSTEPQANKTQPYPKGVWYSESNRHGYRYARMFALWHDGTKAKRKGFSLGRVEDLTEPEFRVAKRAAISFRNSYVACRIAGEKFDPTPWDNWKNLD